MILALALVLGAASPPPPTLERLTTELLNRVVAAGLEAPLGVAIETPQPAFTRAVATVLCAHLTREHRACEVLDAAPERALTLAHERRLSSLLRLTVSVDGATLTARGDGLETWTNLWSGSHPTRSPRAFAVGLTLEADAEVLALSGAAPAPVAPLVLSLTSVARWASVPAALAAGDLDGDKTSELAVLIGEEVQVLTPSGKVLARYDLSAGPSASPWPREPFGALAITGSPPRLVAWSGRRARAEVLTLSDKGLKATGTQDTVPLDGLGVRLEPGLNRFFPEAQLAGRPLRLPSGFQATSTRAGVTLLVLPDGTALLGRQLPGSGHLLDVGCGSALADLDHDALPELLVSTARTVGDTDELRLLSLATAEQLAGGGQSTRSATPLWQAPLKGRAMVMTGADLEGDGTEAFVFGTWLSDGTGELWIARRAAP